MSPFDIAAGGLLARRRTLLVDVVVDRLPRRASNLTPVIDIEPGLFERGSHLRPELHGDFDLIAPRAGTTRAAIQRVVEGLDDLPLLSHVDADADGLCHAATDASASIILGGRA